MYDPQIGFALESPIIPNGLTEFTCMSNYTPSQISKIPYDSYDRMIQILIKKKEREKTDVL